MSGGEKEGEKRREVDRFVVRFEVNGERGMRAGPVGSRAWKRGGV